MTRFAGLRAIVTGGSSGIGAEVVRQLLAEGAAVAVLDRHVDGADPAAIAIQADIADDASVQAGVAGAVEQLGGLDVLVNNAGIGAQGTVESFDADEWRRVLEVNVLGTARVSAAALPHLRRSSSASIVNVASVAATVGLPSRAIYSASKGAVEALTRAMAVDHLSEGIRVNCVHPGTADTPWIGRLLESFDDPDHERAQLNARQPHGRLVTAAEVAAAILYLADPQNGSAIGVSLSVDGGMASLRPRPR